jgi:hypothetical protein
MPTTTRHNSRRQLLSNGHVFREVRPEAIITVSDSGSRRTRVDVGSNTSTVTLRVVGSDEKGSLKSETVKNCRESQGTQTREISRGYGPAQKTTHTPVLSTERALPKHDRNCQTVINIWWWAQVGLDTKTYWLTDWLTDWLAVSCNVTLTLTLLQEEWISVVWSEVESVQSKIMICNML